MKIITSHFQILLILKTIQSSLVDKVNSLFDVLSFASIGNNLTI